MSKYATLIAQIAANIRRNGAQAITGDLLQEQLLAMITSLGEYYQFGGIVSHDTEFTPGDEPVVFIAATPGTYTNFGGLVVADGEVALLVWNGSAWSKQTTDIATRSEVSQLGQEIEKRSYFVVPFNTDRATTRLQVPYAERKNGTILSYKVGDLFITEKFLLDNVSDSQFEANENWCNLDSQSSIDLIISTLLYNKKQNLIGEKTDDSNYCRLASGGSTLPSRSWITSDFIDVSAYQSLYIVATVSNASIPSICCYDTSKNYVSQVLDSYNGRFDIPAGVKYIRVCGRRKNDIDNKRYIIGVFDYKADELENLVDVIYKELHNSSEYKDTNINYDWSGGIIKPDATVADAPTSDYKHTALIPVVAGNTILIRVCSPNSNSRAFAFYQSDGTTFIDVTEGNYYTKGETTIISVPVPVNASFVRLQTEISSLTTENAGIYLMPYIKRVLPNKSTLDKFSEDGGRLLWDGSEIVASISTLVTDLPVSDGTGIESGYAYIDSTDRTIKVKA